MMQEPLLPTSIDCPECGLKHPRIDEGCPIAKSKAEFTKSGISEEKIQVFLKQVKNIILSKSEQITKDQDKFFSSMTIELYDKVESVIKSL